MPTIEERLASRQKAMFAGRRDEVAAFRSLLSVERPEYNIVSFRGIGGIGKTSLLMMLRGVCDDLGVPSARVDASEQQTVINVLAAFWTQLSTVIPTVSFSRLVERYLNLERILQANRNIRPEYLSLVSKGVILGGHQQVTAFAESGDSVSAEEARRAIYNAIDRGDADFYLEPETEFTAALIHDINLQAAKQPVSLMIDTYERISDSLDAWLFGIVSRLEDKVVLVITGRSDLSDRWIRWQPVTMSLELQPFSLQDTTDLLAINGISSRELADNIQRVTGGLPLGIALCADRVREGKGDILTASDALTIVEDVVKNLLRDVSPELRDLLELCSVLHWFNEDMLAEILDGKGVGLLYSRVRTLPFMRPHIHGVTIHDRVRDFLNEDIHHHRPRRYQELHQKAAGYFESQMSSSASVLDRRQALIEVVYHKVRADEDSGINYAIDMFNDAADLFQADLCETIYQSVRYAPLSERNQLWVRYFAGATAKLRVHSLEAETILKEVLDKPSSYLDSKLRVYAGRWLAGSLWFAGKFDEVLKYAEETRQLSAALSESGIGGMKEYEHRAIETIGLAWDRLGEFQKGIDAELLLERSSMLIKDRRGEGWAMNNAGYFYWHSGDWDQSEACLKRCLQIAREIKSDYMEVYPLGHLGLLYVGLGEFDSSYYTTARELLNQCKAQALPATSREMDCKAHQNLAQLELAIGNLEEAESHAQLATQLAVGMVHPYYEADSLRVWGQVLIARGKPQDATAKLLESMSIASRIKGKYVQVRCMVQLYGLVTSCESGLLDQHPELAYESLLAFMGPRAFSGQRALLNLYRARSELNNSIDLARPFYLGSCIDAIQYNRFWCDKIITAIQSDCRQLRKQSLERDALALCDFVMDQWKSGSFQNRPLEDYELDRRKLGQINLARVSLASQFAAFRAKFRENEL